MRIATEAAATSEKRLQTRKDELAAAREATKALKEEVSNLEEDRRELEVSLVATQMELRRVQQAQGRTDTEVRISKALRAGQERGVADLAQGLSRGFSGARKRCGSGWNVAQRREHLPF